MDWNIRKRLAANEIDFFVDTNVFIYAFEGHRVVDGLLLCSPGISVISEIELLGKKGITKREESDILDLLNGFKIINLDDTIKEIAIFLKQKYKLKASDAIIAATAKSFNLPLVTADNDFKKIKDVDIVILDLNK